VVAEGSTIELTNGVFTGAENHNLNFRGKVITVCSQQGDPDSCIIDCTGLGRDPGEPHRGFLFNSGEGPLSVVRGLTIINGIAGAS
jgi:hypothetical protein